MSHAPAIAVPGESDWLCEGCGYVLTGLPAGGRCPECGKLTSESTGEFRSVPAWEQPEAGPAPVRFLRTTAAVLFRPTRFYRSFITRNVRTYSARFAQIHLILTAILFGFAAWVHLDWFLSLRPLARIGFALPWPAWVGLTIGAYLMLVVIKRIAARLTTFEATYRGIRLPLTVVRRGMDYHAAHYLPVGVLAAGTVLGYRLLLMHNPSLGTAWGAAYLYILCGEVIASAAYLFRTYWIGMRNMMYASR